MVSTEVQYVHSFSSHWHFNSFCFLKYSELKTLFSFVSRNLKGSAAKGMHTFLFGWRPNKIQNSIMEDQFVKAMRSASRC